MLVVAYLVRLVRLAFTSNQQAIMMQLADPKSGIAAAIDVDHLIIFTTSVRFTVDLAFILTVGCAVIWAVDWPVDSTIHCTEHTGF